MEGISEKVLTAQLRQLESDGVVLRRIAPTNPPRVTYFLTKAGDELIPLMSDLCHWGTRHLGIPPNLPMKRRARLTAASLKLSGGMRNGRGASAASQAAQSQNR